MEMWGRVLMRTPCGAPKRVLPDRLRVLARKGRWGKRSVDPKRQGHSLVVAGHRRGPLAASLLRVCGQQQAREGAPVWLVSLLRARKRVLTRRKGVVTLKANASKRDPNPLGVRFVGTV